MDVQGLCTKASRARVLVDLAVWFVKAVWFAKSEAWVINKQPDPPLDD